MAKLALKTHNDRVSNFSELFSAFWSVMEFWHERWPDVRVRPWFRGVTDYRHGLDPTLLRENVSKRQSARHLESLEYQIRQDFKVRGLPFMPESVSTGWQEMVLMQHYGFPTRLLDWTESLAVATYFATKDPTSNADGAIWMMAPNWLAHKSLSISAAALPCTHDALNPYAPPERAKEDEDLEDFYYRNPLPLVPDHLDSRIVAQHGRFTVHTYRSGALERLAKDDHAEQFHACFIRKMIIPKEAKPLLKKQVAMVAGATEDMLFPGLDGLARSVRDELTSHTE